MLERNENIDDPAGGCGRTRFIPADWKWEDAARKPLTNKLKGDEGEENLSKTQTGPREAIYQLRRQLGCTEGDAAALIAAATRRELTAELGHTLSYGEPPTSEDSKRHGALTTIVTDKEGDYVLETQRTKDLAPRLDERPSQITFLVSSRNDDGEAIALAIPTQLAFANQDDIAIEHPEQVRPLITSGDVNLDEISATIAEAFYVTDYPDDKAKQAAELQAFSALIEEPMKRAAPARPADETIKLVICATVTIEPTGRTRAEASANPWGAWDGREGKATTVGDEQDKVIGGATALAANNLLLQLDESAARAEALEAGNRERTDDGQQERRNATGEKASGR